MRLYRIKWELRMVLLLLLDSFLLSFLQIHAQAEPNGDEIAKKYMNNVLQITVNYPNAISKDGFGFVVGELNNRLYVVTAKHVVILDDAPYKKPQKILVKFYTEQGKQYEAVLMNLPEKGPDLALLEISSHPYGYKWKKKCTYLLLARSEKVWFIGRNKKWYVPVTPGLVSLPASLGDNKRHIVEITSVLPGTSGAPIFTRHGIVGMILNDDSREIAALDIKTITHVVSQKWNRPYQLEQTQIDLKEEVPSAQYNLFGIWKSAGRGQITIQKDKVKLYGELDSRYGGDWNPFLLYIAGAPLGNELRLKLNGTGEYKNGDFIISGKAVGKIRNARTRRREFKEIPFTLTVKPANNTKLALFVKVVVA